MAFVLIFLLASPQWVEKPTDFTIENGKNVTLKCKATGYPTPKISWKILKGTRQFSSFFLLIIYNGFRFNVD